MFFERLGSWWKDFAEAFCLPTDSEDERTRKALLVIMAGLTSTTSLFLCLFDIFEKYWIGALLTCICFGFTLIGVVWFRWTKRFEPYRLFQLALILAIPFLAQWFRGGFATAGASMVWALAAPLTAVMLHGPGPAVIWFLVYLLLLGISAAADPGMANLVPKPPPGNPSMYFFAHIGGLSLGVFLVIQYFVSRLRQEQERSDSLLLNILPRLIAGRLKNRETTIAEGISGATILFADIVGFTTLSAQLSPEEVVRLLNRVFSGFDRLAEKHGLEKIKTIGDAYLVVGGLHPSVENQIKAVAEMALDMRQEIRDLGVELGKPLQVRIGINSGPVIAGVIGLRKFIYDIWGDAVNIASRMESHGIPGAIQVTETVYDQLSDSFTFERRGEIEIKGRGQMITWFLTGRR